MSRKQQMDSQDRLDLSSPADARIAGRLLKDLERDDATLCAVAEDLETAERNHRIAVGKRDVVAAEIRRLGYDTEELLKERTMTRTDG